MWKDTRYSGWADSPGGDGAQLSKPHSWPRPPCRWAPRTSADGGGPRWKVPRVPRHLRAGRVSHRGSQSVSAVCVGDAGVGVRQIRSPRWASRSWPGGSVEAAQVKTRSFEKRQKHLALVSETYFSRKTQPQCQPNVSRVDGDRAGKGHMWVCESIKSSLVWMSQSCFFLGACRVRTLA